MAKLVREHGKELAMLVTVGLVVRVLTALPLQRPGYMDAAYYAVGAESLYQGKGFTDPLLWNYMGDPAGIPHPSHLYWMPLSSILGFLSYLVLGVSYHALQAPFGLLSLVVPLLAYATAYTVRESKRQALFAGLLAVFSGFYTSFWVAADNFSPFAAFGGLALWMAGRAWKTDRWAWLALSGAAVGLAHLARADGALIGVAIACTAVSLAVRAVSQGRGWREAVFGLFGQGALLLSGYLLSMGPWFLRNLEAIGRLLPTDGTQTMWLTCYDDLYAYGRAVDVSSYLAWGWPNILLSKGKALWLNMQTVLFVGWMIFLAPLGIAGVWRLRKRVEMRAACWYGGILYGVMSLVFTLPSWRGGMFHSLAALLPFMYAAAVEGLEVFVTWASSKRKSWNPRQASTVLCVGLVILAVGLSAVLYQRGLVKHVGQHPYDEVAAWIDVEATPTARVMVNDPATFYYVAGRECLAIPNEPLDTVVDAMQRYEAQYLLLDGKHTRVRDLFDAPESDPRLALRQTFGEGESRLVLLELVRGEESQ